MDSCSRPHVLSLTPTPCGPVYWHLLDLLSLTASKSCKRLLCGFSQSSLQLHRRYSKVSSCSCLVCSLAAGRLPWSLDFQILNATFLEFEPKYVVYFQSKIKRTLSSRTYFRGPFPAILLSMRYLNPQRRSHLLLQGHLKRAHSGFYPPYMSIIFPLFVFIFPHSGLEM